MAARASRRLLEQSRNRPTRPRRRASSEDELNVNAKPPLRWRRTQRLHAQLRSFLDRWERSARHGSSLPGFGSAQTFPLQKAIDTKRMIGAASPIRMTRRQLNMC